MDGSLAIGNIFVHIFLLVILRDAYNIFLKTFSISLSDTFHKIGVK